jgi:transposase InsO family protein
MVRGLPTFKKENARCEACIYGKQNRETFPTGSWRANRCLQLVHSDICGPLETSLGGCKYFLLFIDDFSRMTWVHFLKDKSETFEKFNIFRCLVEKETKEKIDTLRTDNGGEFTSNEFQNYCRDKGIRRKFTNSYTPQHNGVTERMNRTLLGMVRSMLNFKGLSPSYWVEAVHTAVYLRNISPTASLDGITPYEAWYGFKPRIKHLRVFGSVCYALVPKEKRTKLDS